MRCKYMNKHIIVITKILACKLANSCVLTTRRVTLNRSTLEEDFLSIGEHYL